MIPRKISTVAAGLAVAAAAAIMGVVAPQLAPSTTTNVTAAAVAQTTAIDTSGYPTTSTTGVPAGIVLQVAAHNDTGCTNCPPGVTWDTNHGYTAKTCGVTVNGWKFNDSFGLTGGASNGTHLTGQSEAATRSNACVVFTKNLVAPTKGESGQCGICTGFTGGGGNYSCTTKPCGPIFVADTEVSMPQSPTGFSYACSDTNLHLWRVYVHGTIQGCDSDGWSESTDSLLVSDRVNAGCNQSTGSGCAHGDALFQDGGPAGSWWKATHNTFQILANPQNYCSADVGFFGDNAAPNGITLVNNLFKSTGGLCYYCIYTGANQPSKPFRPGVNITLRDNVFERGTTGKCGDNGPTADWDGSGTTNMACNNRYNDGAAAIPDTTNCVVSPPSTTSTTSVPAVTTTTTSTTVPPTTTTTQPPATTVPATTTTVVTTPPTTAAPVTTTTECLQHTVPRVCTVP